jgi:hypothetical protein
MAQRAADERKAFREVLAGEQGDQAVARGEFDPAEIVSNALAVVNYASLLIPPERRDWFVHFLEAGCAGECGGGAAPQDLKDRLQRFQSSTVPHMLKYGVVSHFVGLMDTVFTFDGGIDRGDVYGSRIELGYYSAHVLRELLEDALRANSIEVWQRYPNWFGGTGANGRVQLRFIRTRADAARYIPLFTPSNAVDLSLLDDQNPDVRRYTAMNTALYAPGKVNEQVVKELVIAIQDDDWIWSAKDFVNYNWSGKYSAAELLLKLPDPGSEALSPVSALLRQEKKYRSTLTGDGLEYVRQTASERIERLENALKMR